MTNPYYNRVFDVMPGSTNLSSQVETEYDLVAAGFDGVDTDRTTDLTAINDALALKAPLDSPALTGTPTAPTQLVSDDSTSIATTAFVQDVLGAGGALLPPQSGNSGKFLTTDGTSASWDAVSGAVAWADLVDKPTTLAGFGITNGQYAMEWHGKSGLVSFAPTRVEFVGAEVKRRNGGVSIAVPLPHNLLILAGVH